MSTPLAIQSKERIVSIQYLRALAAVAVVYHHAFDNRLGSSLRESAFGLWGVDIFFIISGFIMWTTTSDKPERSAEFWQKRIVRIYPIYWIALTIWILSRLVIPDRLGNMDLSSQSVIFSYLLLPHYHLMYPTRIWPILVPGWTLEFEVFFYFVFGLCIFMRHRIWRMVALQGTLIALVLVGAFSAPSTAIALTYTSPLLLEFAAGAALGMAYQARARLPFGAAIFAVVVSIPLMVTAEYCYGEQLRWVCFGVPALLLVLGAVSLEQPLVRRPIEWIVTVGDSSYSLYLFHPIIISTVAVVLERTIMTLPAIIFVAISIIASMAISVAIHVLIEKPTVRVFRQIVSRSFWHKSLEWTVASDSADKVLWHKVVRAPPFAKTLEGQSMAGPGQIWRRKLHGKWEYQQEAETADAFKDRQW